MQLPKFLILGCLFFATGCGVTQPLRPVEEGTTEFIASFGGPIIPISDIAIPVPYLNLGAMYGYQPNLTLYGNVHVTALLFKDFGFDAGIATRILPERGIRPELTLNARIYYFWDVVRGTTMRLLPTGTVTGSYRTGERSLWYFGSDQLYQATTSDLFVSPFTGYQFPIGETTSMQVEVKWMAMNHDTRHGVFEGTASIGGKGNIGIFFGFQTSIE